MASSKAMRTWRAIIHRELWASSPHPRVTSLNLLFVLHDGDPPSVNVRSQAYAWVEKAAEICPDARKLISKLGSHA
eukprot:996895-Pleurochrysis_carterae.AAC.1